MAKAPKKVPKKKTAKKVVANSTTDRTRISKPNPQPLELSAECDCCDGAAAYSMIYCEDGVAEHIPPPTVPSFLIYDAGALPNPPIFWCRPNSVPTGMVDELTTTIINNLTPSQCALLAAAIAGNLANILQVRCDGCSCQCHLETSLP